jgi:uncharacterized oligopeptide transporter (OPT) family protein
MLNLFVIFSGAFFAILATAILSYISIATMVGPWIAPAIVLVSSAFLRLRKKQKSRGETDKELALIQTIGSVGGIVGMALGFSLPTLYFLNPELFNNLLKTPFYFCSIITFVCVAAGGFGIWLARCFAYRFIETKQLSFPVSQLIYRIITAQTHEKQTKSTFWGFGLSFVVGFLRDGLFRFEGILLKSYEILPTIFKNELSISLSPMLWAIGFIVGIKNIFPLFIGMLSKYFILYPINKHAEFLPFSFFSPFSFDVFVTAFCSGLVLSELVFHLVKISKKIVCCSSQSWHEFSSMLRAAVSTKKYFLFLKNISLELIIALLLSSGFLFYFKFTFVSQLLLMTLIVIATYQIGYLGGQIGLVTFGRFATFVMIPMMLLFKLDFVQVTFLCVFFNVCAGVASDLLFDYKVGQLCEIDFKVIRKYQWIGLIVASLCVGFFLWILFTNFQLGSSELFAQRGRDRALLIQSLNFDFRVVFIGVVYGLFLKKFKISPTMVFGGILMPSNLSIALLLGAILSAFVKDPEEKIPFCSGIFAGESIWVIGTVLLKLCG